MGNNKDQEIFPGLEFKGPEKGTQGIMEFVSSSKIGTGFYKVFIAEYHQSVNQKGQKVQDAIYFARMVFTMTEIVFKMVPVVFEDVVVLIFYLPTGTGAVYQQDNLLLGDGFIRYPAVFVDEFVLFLII
jgi:hypothetical protein